MIYLGKWYGYEKDVWNVFKVKKIEKSDNDWLCEIIDIIKESHQGLWQVGELIAFANSELTECLEPNDILKGML